MAADCALFQHRVGIRHNFFSFCCHSWLSEVCMWLHTPFSSTISSRKLRHACDLTESHTPLHSRGSVQQKDPFIFSLSPDFARSTGNSPTKQCSQTLGISVLTQDLSFSSCGLLYSLVLFFFRYPLQLQARNVLVSRHGAFSHPVLLQPA